MTPTNDSLPTAASSTAFTVVLCQVDHFTGRARGASLSRVLMMTANFRYLDCDRREPGAARVVDRQ